MPVKLSRYTQILTLITTARFLKFIGADEVQKIKVKDYQKAVTQLNAKKATKQ